MGNILIGLIFIFFEFNLNLNGFIFGLIPDFIGYIFIIKGFKELSDESDYFLNIQPLAKGMVFYSLILYVMNLLHLYSDVEWISIILGLISTVVNLYIMFEIINGVIDIESKRGIDLNSSTLKSVWTVFAILNIAGYILMIIPILSGLCSICSAIFMIIFLVQFNKSKNLYGTSH